MTKIAINGFGRIGRNALHVLQQHTDELELVAINDLAAPEDLFWLTKYDTILGEFPGELSLNGDRLVVDGREIRLLAEKDPADLPWAELGVDIVLESTGLFTDGAKAKAHIDAGAKKVIISAPAKNVDGTFVPGVNADKYDPATMHVISNASCTTNCLAPMAKVLNDEFGIVDGIMTTVHAYTGDQKLHDAVHKKDRRRARAAAQNIVPTSTGAAKALGEVIPELEGKLDGFALRVPVITGSVVDLTVELSRHVEEEEVNAAFEKAAQSDAMKGRLVYSTDPIVSSDIVGRPAACTFDAELTKSIGQTVKIVGWYDNEFGYTNQYIDLVRQVAAAL